MSLRHWCCGQAMRVADTSWHGTTFRCARCGKEIVTPSPIPPRPMRRLLSASMGGPPKAHQIKASSR